MNAPECCIKFIINGWISLKLWFDNFRDKWASDRLPAEINSLINSCSRSALCVSFQSAPQINFGNVTQLINMLIVQTQHLQVPGEISKTAVITITNAFPSNSSKILYLTVCYMFLLPPITRKILQTSTAGAGNLADRWF